MDVNINTITDDDSDPKVIEWEEVNEKDEGASKGELKANCEKLKKVPDYHNRMIPIQKVLDLSAGCILKEYPKALTKEDEFFKFIQAPKKKEEIRRVADAVVKLRVSKMGKVYAGTGFVIPRLPGYDKKTENKIFEFAVLTNFHIIKKKSNGTSDNQVVDPKHIEVVFFYDSEKAETVTCEVSEIAPVFSANVENNVASPKRLDFAFLYINHPENIAKKKKLEDLQQHTLVFEETLRVQWLPTANVDVCVIGHPHGAYKHIALGKLTTPTEDLWREWDPEKTSHSVEYKVATCSGSSGSPVFLLANGLSYVPFLHFQADSKSGDAVSMQTILPNVRKMVANHINPQN